MESKSVTARTRDESRMRSNGFSDGSMVKESACQRRRQRFDPGSGRSPGGEISNPF